jgi:hypothetical protein
MYLTVVVFFIIFSIAYLCGLFDGYKRFINPVSSLLNSENNILLIEHLTQFKTQSKNYRAEAEGLTTYNKKLIGFREGEIAKFIYEFPLIGKKTSSFSYTLSPNEVSPYIDHFGVRKQFISKIDDSTVTINQSVSEHELHQGLNKGGWFFKSYADWGLDYQNIVKANYRFSHSIADHIVKELIQIKQDSYFNRVQVALNFVQYIPYGRPNFDTNEWYYHELAIPAESFIIGYSDCDSKSVFLATILMHLIPHENIVLVDCLVRSVNEKTNGAHMMLAVSGLDIIGENILHKNKNYILLETTAPCVMGKSDWQELQIKEIISIH